MEKTDQNYRQYITILKEELLPAMGCTEPIAIAYLASYAKDILKEDVTRAEIAVSGNVLKNVKSVVVPNTGGKRGIEAAVAAGILFGESSQKLEVLKSVSPDEVHRIDVFLKEHKVDVTLADTPYIFDLILTLYSSHHRVVARIVNYHTNLVYAKRDDEILMDQKIEDYKSDVCDKECLTVEKIVDFAKTVDLADVKEILDRQIEYNMAIAEEGLRHPYGANIGTVLLKTYGNDVKNKMKAYAAAASDARMNGSELPVVIVSGSGNQGITASVPVVVYAREKGYSDEKLYRALLVSDLVTIHLKSGIGRLSAFCGATSAGVGSGAGIAYLESEDFNTIAHTIVNALGIVSGMVCDGAKASCAAKIQSAVDAGILGYHMYQEHQEFKGGDGLVVKGVENTIRNIARLAKIGMKETDKEIISMMIQKC